MIATYTLLVILYTGTGLTTHTAIFLDKKECEQVGKVVASAVSTQANFICYQSGRIDVK